LLAAALAIALVGSAVGLYVAARQTSLFALDRIQVAGAPPARGGRPRRRREVRP